MPLPCRGHPVTQLGWSLFRHAATVEAAVSGAQQSIAAGDTPASTENLRPTRPPLHRLGSAGHFFETPLFLRRDALLMPVWSKTRRGELGPRRGHAEACPSVSFFRSPRTRARESLAMT